MLNFNKTNINTIISSLLHDNIYSIKKVFLTVNNKETWNVIDFNLNKNEFENYITSKLQILDSEFMVTPVININTVNTDETYYTDHKHDAEILYFGLPWWFLSCGTLLIPFTVYNSYDYLRHIIVNKKIQSCEITFYVRRKKNTAS